MSSIERLLIANRGEIAIRIHRACTDLGIRSIAIYSHEDRYSLHRFKADEAYALGDAGEPVRSYLDIERILDVARETGADAVHPGYGFLSENADFARAVLDAGLAFVGPPPDVLERLGDKVLARAEAEAAGLPLIPGSEPMESIEAAHARATEIGYPIMVKAAGGGGGRGLRAASGPDELTVAFESAKSEASGAFGNDAVFLERLLQRPKHIEVQILADSHGDVVHLYERDCSIQRRHQKVLEVAPAQNLDSRLRGTLCDSAAAFARSVSYVNAGTVEFLVDGDEHFFIEMNPRIQVEHTITEEVTDVDLVVSQIRVAEGATLEELGIRQGEIATRGVAVQCRITTEDPKNRFTPDFGRLAGYRSPGGPGVRLDAGSAFSGALITPYYDSLLVKLTGRGRTLADVSQRALRALSEFRVRGVETNVHFLENLLRHETFLAGSCTTQFIDDTPELVEFSDRKHGGSDLVRYLAEVTINGRPGVERSAKPEVQHEPFVPSCDETVPPPPGSRQILDERGAEGLIDWMANERRLLITDTTFRDAHQSLLATRMRTHDMLAIAPALARAAPALFSLEMWGGATFDVAMRFLDEDPWERLDRLRGAIPNILFQMLLRGANAVGYTSYPDSVVRRFVLEAAERGIDIFRVFDSLNWSEQTQVALDAVRESGKIAEASLCYTGDILDPSRERYALDYYVRLAKDFVDRGAHLIAIKDMAGLLKPYAAGRLVTALKDEVGVPIHLHSHDTAGVQAAAYLQAAEAGVDAVDCAFGPLSGSTSQPNLQSIVAMMEANPERNTGLDLTKLLAFDAYWEATRELYRAFDRAPRTGSAEVYQHEIPGGQYTNLRAQAIALGLGERWREVTRMYRRVNEMFGDIVKVTPSSKVVGDLALYMLSNDLDPESVLERGSEISFPESVIGFFEGRIGQPTHGFPEPLQRIVLKGRTPISGLPGAELDEIDFDAVEREVAEILGREPAFSDLLSYILYPKVFRDFAAKRREVGGVASLPTRAFFFGIDIGEEVHVELESGKVTVIRLIGVGETDEEGRVPLFFELNGQPQRISVHDASSGSTLHEHRKADPDDPRHIAAPLTGLVASYSHEVGDRLASGERLCVIEAMKMETNVFTTIDAALEEIVVPAGERVEAGDLLAVLTPAS